MNYNNPKGLFRLIRLCRTCILFDIVDINIRLFNIYIIPCVNMFSALFRY